MEHINQKIQHPEIHILWMYIKDLIYGSNGNLVEDGF